MSSWSTYRDWKAAAAGALILLVGSVVVTTGILLAAGPWSAGTLSRFCGGVTLTLGAGAVFVGMILLAGGLQPRRQLDLEGRRADNHV